MFRKKLLVSEIDKKIKKIISERNAFKSFNPTDSKDYCISIKVKAIPLTKKEQQYLLTYLYNEYIESVGGDLFAMKKCVLHKKYKICTKYGYGYWRYEDFDFM